MKCRWQEGNRITLLENGDQYYPALFAAITRAQRKLILESFIWFEDDVGWQLHAVLLNAARRGIQVEVLLDGYGSADLSESFVGELTTAGVIFRYYDRAPGSSACAPTCSAACIVKLWSLTTPSPSSAESTTPLSI